MPTDLNGLPDVGEGAEKSSETEVEVTDFFWGPGLARTSGPTGTGSCGQKSKRRLSAELAEGGRRRQALGERGHLGDFLAGRVQGRRIFAAELGGPGREVFTQVRHPHQIFTASHQEVLNLVPALPKQVTSCEGHDGVFKILAIGTEDRVLDDVDGQDLFLDNVDSQGLARSGQVDPGRGEGGSPST